MAFLPFVVDSTPLTKIYSNLAGSKEDINFLDILKVFYGCVDLSVDYIRDTYKDNDSLPESKIYSKIVSEHVTSPVVREYVTFKNLSVMQEIVALVHRHKGEYIDGIENLDRKRTAGFYLMTGLAGKSQEFSHFNFDQLFEDGAGNWREATTNLPGGLFDDSGTPYIFYGTEELEAYIIYWGILARENDRQPIRAILKDIEERPKYSTAEKDNRVPEAEWKQEYGKKPKEKESNEKK